MAAGIDDQRLRAPATPRPPRAAAGAPRPAPAGAPPACPAGGWRSSTSAISAGMPACCAARSARASAARAVLVRSRRIAMPATASSCAARDAGGNGAGSSPASVRSASSRRPTSSRRRTSRWRAWAAFSRSPACSSVARAASSALVGQPSSRETSAISASATTQRARATASFGAEGARRPLHQGFCAREIAELRHGDAAQRQRRRVVAQGDPVQGAERITRRQRARRRRDQRVHRESRHTCNSHCSGIRPQMHHVTDDP